MDFAPVAALIKEEGALRKSRQDAAFNVELAERTNPDKVAEAKAANAAALDSWFDKWTETRAALDAFLQPFGLTRANLNGVVP